ncbi:MAG: IS701 family transposase [Oscillatoria sp. SIO1A7]|nr:IS701 family transposase [Oscillatoria sp. SIO1A7]
MSQIARNTVGVSYNKLHHFITESPWDAEAINERRLEVMNSSRQTKPSRKNFNLILDDTGHRKSGTLTAGVGRQYIGEIGKVDNGIVMVTTHLYDGVRSLPLDVAQYIHADSLDKGKENPSFKKKPSLALELIDKCLNRGYSPKVTLIDGGYGNNRSFLKELEKRGLTYIGVLAKNRNVEAEIETGEKISLRLDELTAILPETSFSCIELKLQKPRKVWVATTKVEIPEMGQRTVAIVMNAKNVESATEIDYLITNAPFEKATAEWIVTTYSQRNWIEVFYRDIKGWLGVKEYQTRGKRSIERHWILVFCAYTFILWHWLTGGIARQWASKPLKTFVEVLEAFRIAVSYRFVRWLGNNVDVFASHPREFRLYLGLNFV